MTNIVILHNVKKSNNLAVDEVYKKKELGIRRFKHN